MDRKVQVSESPQSFDHWRERSTADPDPASKEEGRSNPWREDTGRVEGLYTGEYGREREVRRHRFLNKEKFLKKR